MIQNSTLNGISSNQMISQIYICPDCQGSLKGEEKLFRCSSCLKEYPVIDNVPIFSDSGTYYGEINQKTMAKLIEVTKQHGYEKAISKFIKNPFVLTYILDESRATWADLLPLDANTKFLDVGCGWGTNAIPIARKVGHVAAIDATLARVKFVELRARQCGLSNVAPAVASATALPYPAETLDVVALNGVLEWLAANDQKECPKEIQLRALRETHRVLKPGGAVYIGIENRFSLRYFLGFPDDHSFIRFTSLMPRRMSQIYYRLRTGKNYYMHTHSLSVYRQMLKQTGFAPANEYHPWPNYRNPNTFIGLNKDAILNHLGQVIRQAPFMSRKWIYASILKWLTALEGKGFFCHSFSFIYKKQQ
jgi:ubiquinone/menaquinone biosynthesis C-methylase UbiE